MDPTTPIYRQLSRDERLQIQKLRAYCKLTYEEIARRLRCSVRQVQLACQDSHPIPKKRTGRPLFLKKEEIDRLIDDTSRPKLLKTGS